jgi:hypothetical protein
MRVRIKMCNRSRDTIAGDDRDAADYEPPSRMPSNRREVSRVLPHEKQAYLPSQGLAVLERYGWLFTAAVCLVAGYLAAWQRGLYMDDYTHKLMAVDPLTGNWIMPWDIDLYMPFPVRTLTVVIHAYILGILSTGEFWVRVASAIGVGVNALLLGILVYRIVGSRMAAVVAGWLFLMQFYAQEAVLWASAAGYVLGCGLTLVFLHAYLTALQSGKSGLLVVVGTLALLLPL